MKLTAMKHKAGGGAVPGAKMPMEPSSGGRDRLEYIATAAYFKAEARGFRPGRELDDWLEAEARFDEGKAH